MVSKTVLLKCAALFVLLLLPIVLLVSCSTRPYRMKRAERLYRQGQLYLSKGNQEKAIAKYEESLSLSRDIEFKPGVAHNLNEMAIILTTRGEYIKARELLAEAMDIYKELNMKTEVSKSLNNIAITYMKEHNFKEAIKNYEDLVEWDRNTDNELGVAITLNNMGLIYQNHLHQPDEAKRNYSEALIIFKVLGKRKYVELIERNLGTLEP